ncbi:extracellular solute-binding protein [Paenibacillus sp. LMG 31458]|uniref:Extracellular solute-binding protein n=2 Tax=Paenibacillus TaxID=44249 RepID=A0ABX1ZCG3_9BACL|nr:MULTISPECIES: extracellular solute-binding protein [Paenibacillus]NOU76685.1 extracellular solute-binding protein [Paenibacillus phytorum]NOU90144.1 extracellular solute-binding protein [Paenibacillus germinis]
MKRKHVSSVLMTTLMVASLAACSNNESASSSTSAPQQTSNTQKNETVDPLGKYAQPVTVTEVLGFRPPEDPKTPKGITPDQNAYLKDLKEMLNIDLKYLWSVPTEQYEQKFSLAVASADLPDILDLDALQFEKLKSQGMLADLTDAYSKYASPALKNYMQVDGGFAMKTTTTDGKLLGIPGFEDPYLSTQLLWIRKDWLNNLNLQPPKTIDDLEKIADAFVKNDPGKTGKNDRYGIAMQKALIGWGFDARGVFNGYGTAPKSWLKGKDGKLAAGEIQPETKNALAKLQSWYQKGLIDKEFALKDENKVVEDIVAGRVGISYGEWWYPNWPLNINKDKDPNAEWEAYQIPSLDGQPGKSMVGKVRMSHIIAVNKKAKNPEAAIKMINFYLEMGKKQYLEKNKAENGYVYNWFVPRIYNPAQIETIYTEVNKALDAKQEAITLDDDNYKNVADVFKATKEFLAGDTKNATKGSNWGQYYSRADKNGGWGITRQIRDSKQVFFNEFYGVPTETQVEKGAQLDKLLDETYTKIIMGAPISEFDKYVESWKKLGGDDITKEVNEWYTKNAVK